MMTTSWGGHLGWFEFGGGRWFVKPVSVIVLLRRCMLIWQVTKFLNMMAHEIDLDIPPVVEKPEAVPGRTPSLQKDAAAEPKPAAFSPMRRKLSLPIIN
jgi:hypothetical protein